MEKMLAPQISVVIPLYNKGLHIARTIQSVLNQTVQDFEIIVVDGHSSDNGPSIVQNYSDPRIHFFLQNSKGVSEARNEGVKYAQSNFIAFLDADDEWLPCHINNLLLLFKKFPDAGFVGTNYKIGLAEGREKKPKIKNLGITSHYGLIERFFFVSTRGYSPIITSSMGIKKDIFLQYGGFLSGKSWGEDHELWGRIALERPVAYCRECSAIWHWDAENRLGNVMPPLEMEPAYNTVKNAFSRDLVKTEKSSDVHEYLAKKEIEYAIRILKSGNNKKAFLILLRCRTARFFFLKFFWIVLCLFPSQVVCYLGKLKSE
jgi:glycosyltransferase involved in cell wall biosynthesis